MASANSRHSSRDRAGGADPLGGLDLVERGPRGADREEQVGVGVATRRAVAPRRDVPVVGTNPGQCHPCASGPRARLREEPRLVHKFTSASGSPAGDETIDPPRDLRKGLTRKFSLSLPVARFLGLAVAIPGRDARPRSSWCQPPRAREHGAGVRPGGWSSAPTAWSSTSIATIDDALVVRHDAATPTGLLAEMTSADVRAALPAVPTLGEVLDVCAGRLVNVEIKYLPAERRRPGSRTAGPAGGRRPRRSGAGGDRVLVSSFDLGSVDRVRSLAPDVPTALAHMGIRAFISLTISNWSPV